MTRTLIVCGSETNDETVALRVGHHLRMNAGIPWKKTHVVETKWDASVCRDKIANVLLYDETLLLYYIGHCSPIALAPAEGLRIGNDELAAAVVTRVASTLIVNGGCHAYALALALEKAGADPEKVGLIAACGADGYSYGQVHEEVLMAWKQRMTYKPWVRLTIDTGRSDGNETRQEDDGETITCHIGDIESVIVPQREPDQGRRWGTLELDKHFFAR